MKEILLLNFTILCIILTSPSSDAQCTAGVALYPGVPISTSYLKVKRTPAMVTNYQKENIHPSSFLIQSTVLNTYLTSCKNQASNPVDIYLHVYFALDSQNNLRLILVPATWDDANKNYVNYHDGSGTVMTTRLAQPDLYNVKDPTLDVIDTNNIPPNNNDNLCSANITTDAIAKAMILSFQTNHKYELTRAATGHQYKFTQSFMLLADDLLTFLQNFPTDMNDPSTLRYMQIYLAVDPTLPSMDKLSLILVGLDGNGNHIYNPYSSAVLSSVLSQILNGSLFDESMPCPQCGVVCDAALDGNYGLHP